MTRSTVRRAGLVLALVFIVLVPLSFTLLPPSPRDTPLDAGALAFLLGLVVLSVISASVGVTILWQRPGNWIGRLLLLGSLILISDTAAWWILVGLGLTTTGALQTALTWWAVVSILPAVFLLFPSVGVFFPDGELPGPRWRRPYVAAAGALLIGLLLQTLAPTAPDADGDAFLSPFAIAALPPVVGDLGSALAIGGVLAALVLAVGSVAVRFRRSTGVERAQIKWLVAAVVLTSIFFPISYLIDAGPNGLLDVISVLTGCLIPIAVGIAVLRYRLYDIDRLISRTVSWAILTGGIVALFALLVVGLQAALAGITQGQTLAVALSTLVAAALFQPARRRVQGAVDRRFDRGRYDAERMAAAFAERLRDDIDLDALTGDLRTTVGRAVRPTSAAIWLIERETP